MTTLLEKAKKIKLHRKNYSPEEMELAIGWFKDEVGTKQLCLVKGIKETSRNSIYNFLAVVLKQALRQGYFELKKKKKVKKPCFKIDGLKVRVGELIEIDGETLELVDYMSDGVHHEFCLGNRKTRKATWGYFLKDRKVELLV